MKKVDKKDKVIMLLTIIILILVVLLALVIGMKSLSKTTTNDNNTKKEDKVEIKEETLTSEEKNSIVNKIIFLGQERQEKYLKKGMKPQPLRVMIIGIPNVGKSTLINRLAKKNAASARNTPGHTRAQQWIRINENFELLDTPGILPPHYEDKQTSINLALIGSIKENILPLDELYSYLIKFLQDNYLENANKRYSVDFSLPENEITKNIALKRGLLIKGGEIDEEKTANIILDDFRSGKLGEITLERL